MIFSLSEKTSGAVNFEIEHTDIFCFFHSQNAVSVPAEQWLQAIGASLKLKRNVLILERPLEAVPALIPSQRWQVDTDFLWLAPRALSVLFEAPFSISGTYNSLKNHLSSFK